MLSRFTDNSTAATRALQAYLVLIGLAWNRQIITYSLLSKEQMEYGDGGILAFPLGCIMGWCHENGLPPLAVLVVNKETGIPGEGLGTVEDKNYPAAQQRVFDFNWFQHFAPTVEELAAAGQRAQAKTLRAPN